MLLFWEFEYEDDKGTARYTSTSDALKNEATYPMDMVEVCDGPKGNILFTKDKTRDEETTSDHEEYEGTLLSVGRDYGFIKHESFPDNVYFLTKNADGNLKRGDRVAFAVEDGPNGKTVVTHVRRVEGHLTFRTTRRKACATPVGCTGFLLCVAEKRRGATALRG